MVRSFLLIAAMAPAVVSHMGVSAPISLDAKVGDAYRYPTWGGGGEANGGACHGQTATAKYTWLWTPKSSGTCEIYQNCWATEPTSLKMSHGAAHDGGLCKLYECTGTITMPPCQRMVLPDKFGTCTMIASFDDCTLKGTMPGRSGASSTAPTTAPASGGTTPTGPSAIRCGTDWGNANSKCGKSCTGDADCGTEKCFKDLTPCSGSATTPPPTPKPDSGLTASKIRCGANWMEANGKCGKQCTNNGDCPSGEQCFADLANCVATGGTPVTSPPTPQVDIAKCVSIKAFITDMWCKTAKCSPAYNAYCSTTEASKQDTNVKAVCQLQAVVAGDKWADVASKYDVTETELKAQNPDIKELTAGVVLEIPGDCNKAKEQAKASSPNAAPTGTSSPNAAPTGTGSDHGIRAAALAVVAVVFLF